MLSGIADEAEYSRCSCLKVELVLHVVLRVDSVLIVVKLEKISQSIIRVFCSIYRDPGTWLSEEE